MENRFVAIDLETTGLNHGIDKITEVGLVRYENGKEVDSFNTLINPGIHISDENVAITGITNDMVKEKPSINEVIGSICEFIGDNVIVGHSIMFDFRFLKKAAANNNIEFEKMGIDTLKISRILLPDLEHRKLDFLCKHFGISDDNHHRADNDARAAAHLYMILCDKYENENKEVFEPYLLSYKVKKEGPITGRQKVRLNRLLELYGVVPDYDIDLLTKNEASRIMDRLVLENGNRDIL